MESDDNTERLRSVPTCRGFIASDTTWPRPYPMVLADPLTLTVGVDIQHFQVQFPAATFEASNAVTTTLRYRRRWSSDASRQEVDAGYWLRAATRTLGSDYVYNRHAVTAEYRAQIGESVSPREFLAGGLNGDGPAVRTVYSGRLPHAARLEQVRYSSVGRHASRARIA